MVRILQESVRPLLVAMTVFALSGCAAVIIGGAVAGGYYVGKDDRTAGQIAEDGTITASIKTKLIGDKYVKAFDVNVDTYENVVTLTGDVTTYVSREQAETIAADVEGVKEVKNQLRVVPES